MSEEQITASPEASLEETAEEESGRVLSPLVDFGSVLSELSATEEAEAQGEAEEVEVSPETVEASEEAVEASTGTVEASLETMEAEAKEAVSAEDSDASWYVIHCYSGYENKVKYNLEQRIETMQMQDQIFAVEVPTEDEIEVKEGKRRTVQRRIFPGYILVQMQMNDDSWYVVRNTPGVTGFVGMGNKPTPLRTEEVHGIMKRMEAEAPKIKVTFRAGQKVRIIDGPFSDFMGLVDEIDIDRAKVRVFVSFFGRETPVELDFLQVEKM
jgi:transcriptional antiterminator NusG